VRNLVRNPAFGGAQLAQPYWHRRSCGDDVDYDNERLRVTACFFIFIVLGALTKAPHGKPFHLSLVVAMWCAALRQTGYVAAFLTFKSSTRRSVLPTTSRAVPSMSTTTTPSSATVGIIPRVKVADAKEPSDGPVLRNENSMMTVVGGGGILKAPS
jgi:hypothetical protein